MRIEQWYDDKNYKSASSSNVLPLKRSAAAFRFRRSIIWSFDAGLLVSGGIRGGRFTIELLDGDNVIFKSKVRFKLLFVLIPLLYTWNYLNNDEFETTIVGGVPTTPETIGFYLSIGRPGAIEQGDMQPAEGSGSAQGEVFIVADWYSPIYRFDVGGARQIPVGATVRITGDSWDFAPGSSEFQFVFQDGGAAPVASTFDPFGALVTAVPDSKGVELGRAWKPDIYSERIAGGRIEGFAPTVHVLDDGLEIVVLQQEAGVVEYQSQFAGWAPQRVKYTNPNDPDNPSPDVVFRGDITMPVSILLPDNSRFHIAVEGNDLVARIVDKNGIGDRSVIGLAKTGVLYSAERAPNGNLLIIGDKGTPVYRTQTIPFAWEKLEKDE